MHPVSIINLLFSKLSKSLYKIKSGKELMEHLSIKDIHDRLAELTEWELIGHEISKEFRFRDFKEAMEFIHKVGEEAERLKHFPDIFIQNNKVSINLTTHEAHGLTIDDFKLARIIEQLV